MILKKSAITSHIWKSIDDLFWDNKDAKVIGLDNEFRNIVMGDSSVTEYLLDVDESLWLSDQRSVCVDFTFGCSLTCKESLVYIRGLMLWDSEYQS
ncbi:unnamed protein product [Lactuca virosa]|uniref:Uncharacterized protein n=1 Tax=Lactuca virosa TaxID=75947 RepID=A0AAU9N6S4_9ASTR|nr:unnamed protein product [Lactuca virosa]